MKQNTANLLKQLQQINATPPVLFSADNAEILRADIHRAAKSLGRIVVTRKISPTELNVWVVGDTV
jgi:predicted Rossmann fold nucleotide-binding protein DprA/Smf involved in DNA uptake